MSRTITHQYAAAVGLVILSGRGSTSYVSRELGIAYAAASELILRMETEGIVAKPNHVGKREVLVHIRKEPT